MHVFQHICNLLCCIVDVTNQDVSSLHNDRARLAQLHTWPSEYVITPRDGVKCAHARGATCVVWGTLELGLQGASREAANAVPRVVRSVQNCQRASTPQQETCQWAGTARERGAAGTLTSRKFMPLLARMTT